MTDENGADGQHADDPKPTSERTGKRTMNNISEDQAHRDAWHLNKRARAVLVVLDDSLRHGGPVWTDPPVLQGLAHADYAWSEPQLAAAITATSAALVAAGDTFIDRHDTDQIGNPVVLDAVWRVVHSPAVHPCADCVATEVKVSDVAEDGACNRHGDLVPFGDLASATVRIDAGRHRRVRRGAGVA